MKARRFMKREEHDQRRLKGEWQTDLELDSLSLSKLGLSPNYSRAFIPYNPF